jgi:quaternary ammonium compound-resistance protein SugE
LLHKRLKNNIAILADKKIKRENMSWIYLFIAGLFEIGWAVGLKYTEGFTKLWPSIITIATMILSFYFLSTAVKTIPIGTAYAIWTGIGAVGTAILGIILFGESKEFMRMFFILLIIVGIVGLKFFSKIPVQ